tara:strand:+ start:54 stop:872 length:819 start_codon:yes stop_codon:yes gene_type:complete
MIYNTMKVALCFIINYKHILNKEHIWRKWIEYNKDIFNVYFYYKDITLIKSEWILKHALPYNYIHATTYLNIIPAYVGLMRYASRDMDNKWFCFLTESCCPIISPRKFREMFLSTFDKSIMSWRKAWWNVDFHKRANLSKMPKELRLGNDPYFIFNRVDVEDCLTFIESSTLSNTIMSGGIANESIFAISLKCTNNLDKVICQPTHMADWTRMMSATSPYLFEHVCERDIIFIETNKKNDYTMFIRKVHPTFSDDVLEKIIFNDYPLKGVVK